MLLSPAVQLTIQKNSWLFFRARTEESQGKKSAVLTWGLQRWLIIYER
jgi:hypothetical protein